MSYQLSAAESVEENLRRIAHEQLDKAITEIEDSTLGSHETVHQVRKRCKKLRGLVRLVRPVFDGYEEENTAYRDAARSLSYVRDAHSIIKTHDDLIDRFADPLDVESFQPIRETLVRRRDRLVEDRLALDERMDTFLVSMRSGKKRVDSWQLDDEGFAAVSGGLAKTYRRGRKAMQACQKQPSTAAFHEWRKRVKYHWHHLRLLKPAWDEVVKKRRNEAKRLSDHLGDDHDLAVLTDVVRQECSEDETLQAYFGLIQSQRQQLQASGELLGGRMFCEPAKALKARYESYWDCWQAAHERPAATPSTHAPA